jgi:putative transposase
VGHHQAQRPGEWTAFFLYVILDVFSRYVVGWTVSYRETEPIAKALIAQSVEQQQITREQLTVHADRGIPMRFKPVAFLMADLGVTRSHGRPYTSTDNPYSEAQFKTLKYRPEFPDRFDPIEQAREFCRGFFGWHSHEHRHALVAERVLEAAYARNAERFVRRSPAPSKLPTASWINKPATNERSLTKSDHGPSHSVWSFVAAVLVVAGQRGSPARRAGCIGAAAAVVWSVDASFVKQFTDTLQLHGFWGRLTTGRSTRWWSPGFWARCSPRPPLTPARSRPLSQRC